MKVTARVTLSMWHSDSETELEIPHDYLVSEEEADKRKKEWGGT
jgi:hypothetical protein